MGWANYACAGDAQGWTGARWPDTGGRGGIRVRNDGLGVGLIRGSAAGGCGHGPIRRERWEMEGAVDVAHPVSDRRRRAPKYSPPSRDQER